MYNSKRTVFASIKKKQKQNKNTNEPNENRIFHQNHLYMHMMPKWNMQISEEYRSFVYKICGKWKYIEFIYRNNK